MIDDDITDVIFRVWKSPNKGVIALFPGHAATVNQPSHCSSFEHVGQHAAADLKRVVTATRPATQEEYVPLKRELETGPYSYTLNVVTRATGRHYVERVKQLIRA